MRLNALSTRDRFPVDATLSRRFPNVNRLETSHGNPPRSLIPCSLKTKNVPRFPLKSYRVSYRSETFHRLGIEVSNLELSRQCFRETFSLCLALSCASCESLAFRDSDPLVPCHDAFSRNVAHAKQRRRTSHVLSERIRRCSDVPRFSLNRRHACLSISFSRCSPSDLNRSAEESRSPDEITPKVMRFSPTFRLSFTLLPCFPATFLPVLQRKSICR